MLFPIYRPALNHNALIFPVLSTQNKNFLLGMFATVASTESKAWISSAETTLPLRFSISTDDSLKDWASICNSSIMKRLLERSRSLRF